ncbi:phosphate/phosphite/phosphonate ABC transporter substrate-binding protein [Vibrio tritonius]|uniref:phosphate/phosphite/phosphonate ABC transporter substrate-binding protein n=1 Tax=Vibrio tritonius TaxID=1435069 RepID=UPI00315D471C
MKLLWCIICFLFTPSVLAQYITFGIVPQQSAIELAKNWGPLLSYLSKKTGYDIQFRTAKDIPEFEHRLARGEFDIAYMNPYHYVVFHDKAGYMPLVREGKKKLKGILVVKKDNPIQSIAELDNSTIAFPSPAAFAATVVTGAELRMDNIAFTPQYVSSHDSVYLNVAKGFFVAGGGVMRTFNNTPEEVRNQLRVLWISKGYTPHAFAYRSVLSHTAVIKIQEALVNLVKTEQGRSQLGNLGMSPLVTAKDSDWDEIRALNINALNNL